MSQEQAERVFFSRSSNLMISPPGMKGVLTDMGDGRKRMVGGVLIEFSPAIAAGAGTATGGSSYGTYRTSDPKVIAYMEERERALGDVFGAEKFRELMMAPHELNQEKNRVIEDQNRLIADLKKQILTQAIQAPPRG